MGFNRKGFWIDSFYSLREQSNVQVHISVETLTTDFIPHKHDYVEMSIILKGTAKHVFKGTEHFLRAGDVFVINVGTEHELKEVSSLKIINIAFLPAFYNHIDEGFKADKGFQNLFGDTADSLNMTRLNLGELSDAESITGEMLSEYRTGKSGFVLLFKANLIRLAVFLSRRNISAANIGALPSSTGLSKAVDHIEKNFMAEINFDKIAEVSGLSKHQFTQEFKKLFFITPTEYIMQLRLEHAKELLSNPSVSITDVAFKSGFNDSNFFTREFKKKTGLTPTAFRQALESKN